MREISGAPARIYDLQETGYLGLHGKTKDEVPSAVLVTIPDLKKKLLPFKQLYNRRLVKAKGDHHTKNDSQSAPD